VIWKSKTIMVTTNNIKLMVTKHEISTFAAVGGTRNMSDETEWASFLAISWGLMNSILTSQFERLKNCNKMFHGILQHSFLLVRLMKLTFLFCECFWIGDAILWRFLDRYTSLEGQSTEQTIRWVLLDTFPLFILDTLQPSIKVCLGKIWSVHI
jgi:hypothetical protein